MFDGAMRVECNNSYDDPNNWSKSNKKAKFIKSKATSIQSSVKQSKAESGYKRKLGWDDYFKS